MQSPPFRILRISNSIPDSQPTLLVNKDKRQQLLAPIPVTNPTNRAGQCGGEGEPKQSPQAPKKEEHHSHETVHTFLIALVNLTQRFQLELLLIILMGMHLQTLHKLCTAKQKAREGKTACGSSCCKETSCSKPIPPQLLWYPSLLQPTSPVPKGFSAEYNTTHQGAATTNC